MVNMHLSDEQVQELALGSKTLPPHFVTHAQSCAHCTSKVEAYKVLFNVIEEQKAPAFDFDLSAAVVAQIETPPAKFNTKGLWWLLGIATVAMMVTAVIYFGEYMSEIFEGIKSLAIILFAISVVVVGIMLMIDQFKNYQRKIKLLDMP